MYTIERFEKEIDVAEYIDGYVSVEEFEECCKACPNYGTVWSCPPYDFDAEGYWKNYKKLLVVARKINFTKEVTPEQSYEIMKEVKADMAKELYKMESEVPKSISLSAGSCDLCQEEGCTRKDGISCRYPDKMRYSIESIGGNVGLTVSKLLGIRLEWIEEGKVPSYFVLVGGLLQK